MHGANHIGAKLMAQGLDVAIDGAGARGIHPVTPLQAASHGEHRLDDVPAWPANPIHGRSGACTVDGDDALGRIGDHGTEIKNLLVLQNSWR